MANVYVIHDSGQTEAMTRIRCRDEDRELQLILENNADLLPGDQIAPEDPRRWLLVKREMPVPDPSSGADRWSIDFLFADQDAIPTFVECKRFADTRSRREVVGQMLEYAANGHHYWSKDELRSHAAETASKRGVSLGKLLRELQQPNAEEYFERMQENLREGQLRIIFFLEEAPPELRSLVDFLNRQMERSEVLLVEARQYTHAGMKIVVPMLFGYTEEARTVKRTVTITTSTSRRHWDRTSYFSDAANKLSAEQVQMLESLLDNCIDLGLDITWGTGARNGSFNIKEASICQKSLLSCYSGGDLWLNFHWLDGSETARRARNRFRGLLVNRMNLSIPSEEKQVMLAITDWTREFDGLVASIKELVSEFRAEAA